MAEFTKDELAEAMSKLLDGRWRIRAKEIDTGVDRVTFFELIEGTESLEPSEWLEVVLEQGMERSRARLT